MPAAWAHPRVRTSTWSGDVFAVLKEQAHRVSSESCTLSTVAKTTSVYLLCSRKCWALWVRQEDVIPAPVSSKSRREKAVP